MDGERDAARFRFSVRGLLIATAAVAVMAAPISWLGGIYAASLATSLLMLGLVSLALWKRSTVMAVFACLSGLIPIPAIFANVFFSPAAAWQMFLTPMAIVATHAWCEQPYRRIVACAAVMAAVYGFALNESADRYRQVAELRGAYPVESIADRLPRDRGVEVQNAVLSVKQDEYLNQREWSNGASYASRAAILRRLHNERVMEFATAFGFGLMRMRPLPSLTVDELAERPPVNIPLPYDLTLASKTPRETLYQRSTESFLSTERTGYAESLDHAIGFASHALISGPGDRDFGWRREDESRQQRPALRLDRLDLISLLLHDEPVAYVSDKLPNMEELRGAQTRELGDFERASLEKLRGPSDLEIDEEESPEGKRIRMVGALRAGADCAACHDAPRGTLLGAFSYDLTELAATSAAQ